MIMKVLENEPTPDRYCPHCNTFLDFKVRIEDFVCILALSCPTHGIIKEYAIGEQCPDCKVPLEVTVEEGEFEVTLTLSCQEHGKKDTKTVSYSDFFEK